MDYNLLDDDGYPSEECLNKIKYWEVKNDNDFLNMMSFIKSVWKYAEDGYWEEKSNAFQNTPSYYLHTGGWSGNEDIIGMMMTNTMFWIMYWEQSRRGGHYIFSKM